MKSRRAHHRFLALTERQLEVLRLYEQEGLGPYEIAKRLGISFSSANNTLNVAIVKGAAIRGRT